MNKFNLPTQMSFQLFTNSGETNSYNVMAMIKNHPYGKAFHVMESLDNMKDMANNSEERKFIKNTFVTAINKQLNDIEYTPTTFVTNGERMVWVVFAKDNFSILIYQDPTNQKKWHRIIQPLFAKIDKTGNVAPYYTSTFKCGHCGYSSVEATMGAYNAKAKVFSKEEKLAELTKLMSLMDISKEEVMELLGVETQPKTEPQVEPEQEPECDLDELLSTVEEEPQAEPEQPQAEPEQDATQLDSIVECVNEKLVAKYSVYNSPKYITNKFYDFVRNHGFENVYNAMRLTDGSLIVTIDEYINAIESQIKQVK